MITLVLAESDDVHREQPRIAMAEPYRTLLGHFRHEIGHYYFYRLVGTSTEYLPRLRELFGDPDTDYQAALERQYKDGRRSQKPPCDTWPGRCRRPWRACPNGAAALCGEP